MDEYQNEDLTDFSDLLRDWRRLLTRRAGNSAPALYLRLGLPLLILVTAGIYIYALIEAPWLLGSVAGGYRADLLLLLCALPSFVLAGLFFAYLLPKALYRAYRDCLNAPDGAQSSFLLTYWAAALIVLLSCGAAFLLGKGVTALGGVLSLDLQAVAEIIGFCLIYYSVMLSLLSLPVSLMESKSGFAAVVRGCRVFWRAKGNGTLLLVFPVLALLLLNYAFILLLRPLYAISGTLRDCAFVFLAALLSPLLLKGTIAMLSAFYPAAVSPDGQTGMVRQTLFRRAEAIRCACERSHEQTPNLLRRERTNMKSREQIDPSLQWDLTHIYPTEEAWEADFTAAQALVKDYPAHAGKLCKDADALLAALTDESAMLLLIERLYSYAHLHKDEDNGNVKYQGMTDRAMQLYISASAASAFLEPEILAIPAETLHAWMAEERFSRFRFRLQNVDRRRAHTLSTSEERLLAMAEEPLSGPDNIFTMLSDVDLDLGFVTDENGEKIKLTHGSYSMFIVNPDRRVRREAYQGLYRAYRSVGNTIAATYATSVKGDVFRARAHCFDGALEAALFDNGVPVAVYEQLIEAVHEMLPALQKYLSIRKRVLGVDELEMYDLYVPIVTECDDKMSYNDAKAFVKEALRPLGEHYGALLDKAFSGGWIDVYETPGKTSGAFSSGLYGVHPFVLLNYQGQLDDAFTLGHELGHAMHSYHSDAAQPFETSQYRIMVAEVASTVNETLMTRFLLNGETDETKRAYYITQFLESFRTTCFRQTMFAEFELKAHRMAETGEPLTVESLSAMYRGLNERYYANAHVDDEIAIEWMRIPHFYSAFYVYQYATGLCSAVKLADDILDNGAIERYLAFLSSGGSDHPIEELKAAGVDLTNKESILAALKVFAELVDELDALMR